MSDAMKDFVRASTEEQIADRREEIISACEEIYLAGGYDAVTFKAISEKTSFSRPSIYNYFDTKEEVMMDLLTRYFVGWLDGIKGGLSSGDVSRERFCRIISEVSAEHENMFLLFTDLKLIEDGSGISHIIAFKGHFREFIEYICGFMDANFHASEQSREGFLEGLMMLFYGSYPHTHLSDKQTAAMEAAGVPYASTDLRTLFYRQLMLFTSSFRSMRRHP